MAKSSKKGKEKSSKKATTKAESTKSKTPKVETPKVETPKVETKATPEKPAFPTKPKDVTDENFEQRGEQAAQQRAELRTPHLPEEEPKAETPQAPEPQRGLVQAPQKGAALAAAQAEANANVALASFVDASMSATQQTITPGVAFLNGMNVLLAVAGQIGRQVGEVANSSNPNAQPTPSAE